MKNLKMSFWERQLEDLLKHFWNFDFNISGKSNLSIWRNTSGLGPLIYLTVYIIEPNG